MPNTIPRLSASDPVDQILAGLDREGAVIVEGVLDAETLKRFNDELDPQLEATDPGRAFLNPGLAWFFGKRTRHVTAVASKSRTFAEEILCHPVYLGVCDAILGPACARYQLNLAHEGRRSASQMPSSSG